MAKDLIQVLVYVINLITRKLPDNEFLQIPKIFDKKIEYFKLFDKFFNFLMYFLKLMVTGVTGKGIYI